MRSPYCWKKPFVYSFVYQPNLLINLKALLHCHRYTWIWIKCKNNIEYHNSLVSMGWSPYVCFFNAVSLYAGQKPLYIYWSPYCCQVIMRNKGTNIVEYQPNLLIDLKALLHCHRYTWIWIKCKNNIEYHNSLVSMGWSPYVCFFNAVSLLLEKNPFVYIFVYQPNVLIYLKALLHCHRYTWIWIKCKHNIEYHNSLVSMGGPLMSAFLMRSPYCWKKPFVYILVPHRISQ